MASPIEVLWKQALKTFGGRTNVGYNLCPKNFDKLHALINNIKADDLKVDKQILDYVENRTTPMCVIDVFENPDVSITVFFLKQGVTLPLHDHPGMHGLLKVINGTVKIDSFTKLIPRGRHNQADVEITALRYPSIMVQKSDPACVLSPYDHNLHEIMCIKGPAAFLDIISPPYKVDRNEDGVADRPCTYFRQISADQFAATDGAAIKVKLMTTDQPWHLHATSLKYMGPPLQ